MVWVKPNYWFVSSFLLYYGSTWLILLGSTFLISDKNMFAHVWDIKNVVAILRNIMLFVGFKCIK
jgi:hypothetical protein